ncbi:MAG: hypothetical protein R3B92_00575 [Patescibacteria group bacterium]
MTLQEITKYLYIAFFGLITVLFVGVGIELFATPPEWTDPCAYNVMGDVTYPDKVMAPVAPEPAMLQVEPTEGIMQEDIDTTESYIEPTDTDVNPMIMIDPNPTSPAYNINPCNYDTYQKQFDKQYSDYEKIVSTSALIASVILLALALVITNSSALLSNGVMLGSVFTLVYSMIRVSGSADSLYRFGLVTVGLAITLVIGLLKFNKD